MKKKWWHDKSGISDLSKSFLDTNGDGIGDLRGIISKLDYLKSLALTSSGSLRFINLLCGSKGYDISDYYAIAQEFGTMEEFDELLAEAKKRGMYIVMDLVVNHCSDQHEWFKGAGRSGWRICRLLLLCEGKRRQGAEQLPLVFWRKCVGAGAGNGQILPAHVRKRAAGFKLGKSRLSVRRSTIW